MDSSQRTAVKNQQAIYANILMQERQMELGILGKITYCGGGNGADYTNTLYNLREGSIVTPLVQQELILRKFIRNVYTVTTYIGTGILPSSGSTNLYIDSMNNIYISLNHMICKIDTAGNVTTVAGQTGPGPTNNVYGTNAQFKGPRGITMDRMGNLYVAERNGFRIRKIDTTGYVTTLAGQLNVSVSADGIGTNATFNSPFGMTIDSMGNLYVVDRYVNTIRKITTTGMVTTLAGQLIAGYIDWNKPTGPFNAPSNIEFDSNGNLYIVDTNNHMIRMIDPFGNISTVAGQLTPGFADGIGTNAQFSYPYGITLDSTGNVYVADSGNNIIRMIDTFGNVTTVAGRRFVSVSADGIGTNATFNYPYSIKFDSFGNLYVLDATSNIIRKITITAI